MWFTRLLGPVLNQCALKPDVPSLPAYLQQMGAVGTAIAAAAQAANTHFIITSKGGGIISIYFSLSLLSSMVNNAFKRNLCLIVLNPSIQRLQPLSHL